MHQRTEFFLISLALLLWLGATLNMRPLSNPDEGRYVSVAWEMVRSGQWLTPTLDGLPYFHKPPLFYWITALSIRLFGIQEWAVRIAPMTGALIAALSIYYFLRRRVSADIARISVLILATSPFFYGGAQFANHDMLVAGCITAAIVGFADAVLCMRNKEAYHLPLLIGWIVAALGLLSKGLIGVALPGGVLVCWLILEGEARMLTRLCWWPALLLFTVIALPWFAAMEMLHSGFLHYFFIEQQLYRYVGTSFNNKQGFWFLPAALILLSLPWIILLYTRLRLPRSGDQTMLSLRRLFWVWLIVIILFFSIPESKLIGYLLPLLPALAALIAEGIISHPAWGAAQSLRLPCISLLVALFCIAGITGIAVNDTKSSRHIASVYLNQARPEEALVFLNTYPFDMIFYAKIASPVIVFDDWEQAKSSGKDNWRKELLDAANFAASTSEKRLQSYATLPAYLCAHPVTWILAPETTAPFIRSALHQAQLMANNKHHTLWRISRSAFACS